MKTLRLRRWNVQLIGLALPGDPEAVDVTLSDREADILLAIHAQACDLQNQAQSQFEKLIKQKPN